LLNERLLNQLPSEGKRRMPSATPADVLARRSQLILNGDADGFAALFAPDAVIESSFAGPPGTPVRLEGREAIREYSRRVMASPLRLEDFEVAELYQTQDPEVVIAEMRAKGIVTTTGRSFAATSVQILRIREGHIVLFRDFADPRVLEDVIGEPRPGRDTPQVNRSEPGGE
jgi:ketosteroid isomerase-like protein